MVHPTHRRRGAGTALYAKLVEELSLAMTLLPGDILLTGTPEGVGYARTPPEYLSPGDEVTVTVTGIGEITNRVVERSLTRQENLKS